MAEYQSERRNSNTQLLQELEALSQSLYQSHTTRRTASLALPRSSAPPLPDGVPAIADITDVDPRTEHRFLPRRMSMSPWRSRPKHQSEQDDDRDDHHRHHLGGWAPPEPAPTAPEAAGEKKGIWSWKPMRALSHIGMQRLGCLFSVEVITVQGLPASMNGLRVSVAVRKKETKDGAVQTMPSRVLQGCADFEETLFIRCHVYCSGGGSSGKPLKFEPRPFLIFAVAIDAPMLDFGKSTVDLSLLVKESMEKNIAGARVRQWDRNFELAGKAKGGEMLLKLGFQIMEDGGVGIYNQPEAGVRSGNSKGKGGSSSPFARRQSKSSFSVTSPSVPSRLEPAVTPSNESSTVDIKGVDDFNLDEPPAAPLSSSPTSVQKSEPDARAENLDLPEFEVVDKGVEIEAGEREDQAAEAEEDERSVTSEVIVKEMVPDPAHQQRLTKLDSIAKQIEALESMMAGNGGGGAKATAGKKEPHGLDADEETVTREFLQMLELEDSKERGVYAVAPAMPAPGEDGEDGKAFVTDLGKGVGSVVQTKDGGFLAALNPFNVAVPKKETPKLAMQISKPLVLRDQSSASGFEVFQRMAAMGSEELASALVSLTSMDDLMGKTAEQIAFEGIASAIISGRNKEGASSSAAKSIAAVKAMAASMEAGRKERISTGIWNVSEEPVAAAEVLAFALQKIEAMVVEALKIQADMAEEEAPFDVFTLARNEDPNPPLAAAVPLEEWAPSSSGLTVLVVVQLRDPLRRYETVGAPVVALVQAAAAADGGGKEEEEEEEEGRFKVGSLHVGGLRARGTSGRSGGGGGWEGERLRLTAMQWLVAHGMGRKGKGNGQQGRGGRPPQELLWSMSSRLMAGMWLKPVRNPDVKFPRRQ